MPATCCDQLANLCVGYGEREAYPVRCNQCQPSHDPAALTCSQCERLLHANGIKNLQTHMRSIPVRKRLHTRCSKVSAAMTQRLNGNQINCLCQLGLVELGFIEVETRGERVNEEQGGSVLLVGAGHAVLVGLVLRTWNEVLEMLWTSSKTYTSFNAAQMRDADCAGEIVAL